jgi:hypothetical protein
MAVPKRAIERVMRERNAFEDKLLVRAWQDENFKKQLLADPSGVIEKEVGQEFPEGCKFEVIEEAPNTLDFVLPRKLEPIQASEELSDEALENVAGGAGVIMGGKNWNCVYMLSDGTTTPYFVWSGA